MNDVLIKRIIISLLILFTLILFIVLAIMIKKRDNNSQIPNDLLLEVGENGQKISDLFGSEVGEGVDAQTYLNVKTCMQNYINIINTKSSLYSGYDNNQIKSEIFKVLSNKYISDNNITKDNVQNYVEVLDKAKSYTPIEIKLINNGEIKSYLTSGIIGALPYYDEAEKIYAIVNIDFDNQIFSVEPIYEEYETIQDIKNDKFEENIENNKTNRFTIFTIGTSSIPEEYLNIYKSLALSAPEILYDLIDIEYRNSKFPNLDDFKQYIENNKTKISRIKLNKYKILQMKDENRIYLCIDDNNNNYVINQKEAFRDYSISLDLYTVDLPQFIEEYNSAQADKKVVLNIEKITEAIKNDDYAFVYNKLDETFKKNNYPTLDEFKNYFKNTFNLEKNSIEYVKYEKVNSVHIYEVDIINKEDEIMASADIIMKLLPERDFVFSFGIKED